MIISDIEKLEGFWKLCDYSPQDLEWPAISPIIGDSGHEVGMDALMAQGIEEALGAKNDT